MSTLLMLQDKRVLVFGGGGSIDAAVAKELASEGAEVFSRRPHLHRRASRREGDHGCGWTRTR